MNILLYKYYFITYSHFYTIRLSLIKIINITKLINIYKHYFVHETNKIIILNNYYNIVFFELSTDGFC